MVVGTEHMVKTTAKTQTGQRPLRHHVPCAMYHVPHTTVALADVPELADLLVERARIVMAGESMAPALRRGDEVIVEPLRERAPQAGEIVIYRRAAQWICHRVVQAADPVSALIVTQGDAVRQPDAPVPLDHVVGRVVGVAKRRSRWWRCADRWTRRATRHLPRPRRTSPIPQELLPRRPWVRCAHPLRDHADRWALPLYDPRRARPLTREERVLQWSVWSDEVLAVTELAQLLRAPLDWWFILHQARRHAVISLLYQRLRLAPQEAVPAGVLAALQQGAYQIAAANTRQCLAAIDAARGLRDSGVRVVALKGFVMAQHYYRDMALRPMEDVDFLVESSALPAAEACLRRLGYDKLRAPQAVYVGPHQTGVLALEIHPPEEHPFYDLRAVLARAQSVDGQPYAVPTAEDMLLFSGLHMTLHHVWMRLIWVADLARLITAEPSLDWTVVCGRLQGHPGRLAMYHALRAARDVCGARVPHAVLAALAPQPQERRRAAILEWLLAHPPIPRLGFIVRYLLGRAHEVSLAGFRRRLLPSVAMAQQRSGRRTYPQLAAWQLQRAGRLTVAALATVVTLLRYTWYDSRRAF